MTINNNRQCRVEAKERTAASEDNGAMDDNKLGQTTRVISPSLRHLQFQFLFIWQRKVEEAYAELSRVPDVAVNGVMHMRILPSYA